MWNVFLTVRLAQNVQKPNQWVSPLQSPVGLLGQLSTSFRVSPSPEDEGALPRRGVGSAGGVWVDRVGGARRPASQSPQRPPPSLASPPHLQASPRTPPASSPPLPTLLPHKRLLCEETQVFPPTLSSSGFVGYRGQGRNRPPPSRAGRSGEKGECQWDCFTEQVLSEHLLCAKPWGHCGNQNRSHPPGAHGLVGRQSLDT